jgi:hypothetical protein
MHMLDARGQPCERPHLTRWPRAGPEPTATLHVEVMREATAQAVRNARREERGSTLLANLRCEKGSTEKNEERSSPCLPRGTRGDSGMQGDDNQLGLTDTQEQHRAGDGRVRPQAWRRRKGTSGSGGSNSI